MEKLAFVLSWFPICYKHITLDWLHLTTLLSYVTKFARVIHPVTMISRRYVTTWTSINRNYKHNMHSEQRANVCISGMSVTNALCAWLQVKDWFVWNKTFVLIIHTLMVRFDAKVIAKTFINYRLLYTHIYIYIYMYVCVNMQFTWIHHNAYLHFFTRLLISAIFLFIWVLDCLMLSQHGYHGNMLASPLH